MKILVVGDFHGKFSNAQFNKLKKENPDAIFSVGDFCGNPKWTKIFFKYFYAKSKKEKEEVPKKYHNQLIKEEMVAMKRGIEVLKKIKKFDKPFFTVHGNWDPNPYGTDLGTSKEEMDSPSFLKKFHRLMKKDFEFIDFKLKDFGDFVIVGGTSSTHPGKINKKSLDATLKKYEETDPKEGRKIVATKIRQYRFRERRYIKLFSKARKKKKPVVFLTHNSPYGTRLDKIRDKKAPKIVRGQHYGSYVERLMINRFKPDLVLCGHLHENFGKQKLGKTLVVNSGAIFQGEYVVVDFNEKTKKFKVKLKRL